jgi:hypothetical protein
MHLDNKNINTKRAYVEKLLKNCNFKLYKLLFSQYILWQINIDLYSHFFNVRSVNGTLTIVLSSDATISLN